MISKSQKKNKMLLIGIGIILLGIVLLIGLFFSGFLASEPAGKLYEKKTGINEFLQNKPIAIFIDDTLSPEAEAVAQELARAYDIDDIKVLTDDTMNTSNAIVIAKKENNNIMVAKEKIGLESGMDENLVKVDDEYNMLFIIGDEIALKDTVDILKNSQCSQLNNNAVIIKSGSGCNGIREQVLCSID